MENFTLGLKKAKAKAKTINEKSKLVLLHSIFIHRPTHVIDVDFF